MRLITVRAPAGEGIKVNDIAFKLGIREVAISTANVYRQGGEPVVQDVLEIETATPIAKSFIEALMTTSFYNPSQYSFTIRHPESLFGAKPPKEDTSYSSSHHRCV